MFYMTEKEMASIYKFNQEVRDRLLKQSLKQPTAKQRLEFVAKYFLNALPLEVIAEIDGVGVDKVIPFAYDYSFLEDYGSIHIREKQVRKYPLGKGVSLPVADIDVRNTFGIKDKIKIYPTIYSLKLGTCIMLASEMQRFAHDFNIQSQIVKKMDYCYDKFDGKSTEFAQINTDRLIKMEHFFNVFIIDGKKYKLDIAGILTAKDFVSKHKNLYKTNEKNLYFSQDLDSTLFDLRATNDVIDLLKESQSE